MKTTILMIALPVACIAAGYGVGLQIAPADAEAVLNERPAADHSEAPEPGHAEVHVAAVTATDPQHEGVESGASKVNVVEVGRMTVPVLKRNSVTYVVADFAVSLSDSASAAELALEENSLKLKDAIQASFERAAETPALAGASIDTDALAKTITADLKPQFDAVEDVLFLNFYKQDVARPQPAT